MDEKSGDDDRDGLTSELLPGLLVEPWRLRELTQR